MLASRAGEVLLSLQIKISRKARFLVKRHQKILRTENVIRCFYCSLSSFCCNRLSTMKRTENDKGLDRQILELSPSKTAPGSLRKRSIKIVKNP